MSNLIKVSFWHSAKQKQELKEIAKLEKVSVAEVVRRALDDYLKNHPMSDIKILKPS